MATLPFSIETPSESDDENNNSVEVCLRNLINSCGDDRGQLVTTINEIYRFAKLAAYHHDVELEDGSKGYLQQGIDYEQQLQSDDISTPPEENASITSSETSEAQQIEESPVTDAEATVRSGSTQDSETDLESEQTAPRDLGTESNTTKLLGSKAGGIRDHQTTRAMASRTAGTAEQHSHAKRLRRGSVEALTNTPVSTAKGTKRDRSEHQLTKIDTFLSLKQTHVDKLIDLRQNFYTKLYGTKLKIKRDQKPGIKEINNTLARDITQFFFSDLLGEPARERVQSIVSYYSTTIKDGRSFPKGVTRKAELTMENPNTPKDAANMLNSFSRVTRAEHQGNNKAYDDLLKFNEQLNFVRYYDRMQELAKQKDSEVRQHFMKLGLMGRSGITNKSLVVEYMVKVLGVERRTLQSMIQTATAIQMLVSEFGPGILVVAPPSSPKLGRWGHQVMTEVYNIIQKEVPGLRTIFKPFETNILEPVLRGDLLKLPDQTASRNRGNSVGLMLEQGIEGVLESMQLGSPAGRKRKRS